MCFQQFRWDLRDVHPSAYLCCNVRWCVSNTPPLPSSTPICSDQAVLLYGSSQPLTCIWNPWSTDSDAVGLGRDPEMAFLASSKVVAILLVWGPHVEKPGFTMSKDVVCHWRNSAPLWGAWVVSFFSYIHIIIWWKSLYCKCYCIGWNAKIS